MQKPASIAIPSVTAPRIALLALLLGAFFSLHEYGSVFFPGNPHPAVAEDRERIAKILSLLESQRDCDAGCLGGLRSASDKSAALENVLGQMQADKLSLQQSLEGAQAEGKKLREQGGRLEAELSEMRSSHAREVSALEKRLAQSADAQKPAKRDDAPKGTGKAPAKAAAGGEAAPAPAAQGRGAQWTVIGMTATTVVVSNPKTKKVSALAVGESVDGIGILRINVDQGEVETSAGTLRLSN